MTRIQDVMNKLDLIDSSELDGQFHGITLDQKNNIVGICKDELEDPEDLSAMGVTLSPNAEIYKVYTDRDDRVVPLYCDGVLRMLDYLASQTAALSVSKTVTKLYEGQLIAEEEYPTLKELWGYTLLVQALMDMVMGQVFSDRSVKRMLPQSAEVYTNLSQGKSLIAQLKSRGWIKDGEEVTVTNAEQASALIQSLGVDPDYKASQ